MTDYTVKELEEKIMNGETVSPSEFADAMRNAAASDRIAQLTTQRIVRNAQADADRIKALREMSNRPDLTPFEELKLANQIELLEAE